MCKNFFADLLKMTNIKNGAIPVVFAHGTTFENTTAADPGAKDAEAHRNFQSDQGLFTTSLWFSGKYGEICPFRPEKHVGLTKNLSTPFENEQLWV